MKDRTSPPSADPLVQALQSLVKKTKGGYKAVAQEIGANDQSLYQVISCRPDSKTGKPKSVGKQLRDKLDERYPDWLATGEGAATPPAASNIQDAPYSRPNLRNLHQVPVIGTTQGGFPDRIWTDGDFPPGDSDSYAECSTADENAFLCRVVGDSMAPRYRPGEFCLVEPNTEAEIEDDVLVRLVTGETMLKRLLGLRGGLRLGSYNDSTVYTYEPGEVRWYYYVAHGVPARKIRHRIETATYNGRDRRWVDAPGHPARRAEDAKVDQPAAGVKPAA